MTEVQGRKGKATTTVNDSDEYTFNIGGTSGIERALCTCVGLDTVTIVRLCFEHLKHLQRHSQTYNTHEPEKPTDQVRRIHTLISSRSELKLSVGHYSSRYSKALL
jgi:hypothetical protein